MMDRDKVNRTLDAAWIWNQKGRGMIAFIANWFALADTYYGRGDHALEVMERNMHCLPESLSETDSAHSPQPYFPTSYATYAIVPVSMMVQSYDNLIRVFPAVPGKWKDVSFHNVPAESGIRVSGEMKEGKVVFVSFMKDGRELLRLTEAANVKVVRNKNGIELEVQ